MFLFNFPLRGDKLQIMVAESTPNILQRKCCIGEFTNFLFYQSEYLITSFRSLVQHLHGVNKHQSRYQVVPFFNPKDTNVYTEIKNPT